MLASVAVRPQPGQKLPNGVLNLDEHPMLTPVVELGNRLLARSEQVGVPGIVGSVPAGQLTMISPDFNGNRYRSLEAMGSTPPPPPPPPMASDLATAPPLINKVDPMYPALARQARISGDVHLRVGIATDGHVQRLEVVSGHPLLVGATMDAVKQWVYAPIPAAGTILVTVPFRIDAGNAPLGNMTSDQARQQQAMGIPGGVIGGVISGVPGGVNGGVVDGVIASVSPSQIKIGPLVQAGKLASKVDPVYPEQARAAGIEGDVVLDVTIGTDGHVLTADPRDGNAVLATAAVEAVKQWVYQPTLLNGEPVGVRTTVTVPFKLQ
jgi:TonB family protein